MDKIDRFLFKGMNPSHEPMTGTGVCYAFVGGLIAMLLIFLTQMFSSNKDVENVVTGILLVALIGFVMKTVWPSVRAFDAWWKSALYVFYTVFLTGIAFQLAMWVFLIVLAGLVLMVILKIMYPSRSYKGEVTYSDGTKKKAHRTGKGICGEEYWEDEDGNRLRVD